MNQLEESIRTIVREEFAKREPVASALVPISEFCLQKNLNRVTLWRHEKEGSLKLVRIGRKVFIDPNQFGQR